MKKFKKNQKIVAKLPSGKVVEGYYLEPYGAEGHSFYVNEFTGIGKGGDPVYKKTTYGVQDPFIDAAPVNESEVSVNQYKAWLKRAIDLEARIKESEELISNQADGSDKEKEMKKLERHKQKLAEIEKKIKEYEGE